MTDNTQPERGAGDDYPIFPLSKEVAKPTAEYPCKLVSLAEYDRLMGLQEQNRNLKNERTDLINDVVRLNEECAGLQERIKELETKI